MLKDCLKMVKINHDLATVPYRSWKTWILFWKSHRKSEKCEKLMGKVMKNIFSLLFLYTVWRVNCPQSV